MTDTRPLAAPSPRPAAHHTWDAAALTDIGLARASNEDAAWIGADIALVADGLGGHSAGEVASTLTVHAVAAALLNIPRAHRTRADIVAAVRDAHRHVLALAAANEALAGMATTLTGVVRLADRVAVLNVGDSRTYRLQGDHLVQVTRDDSLVADLVDAGHISAAFAPHHPRRNIVTNAVGLAAPEGRPLPVTVLELGPDAAGRFVICSDGLSDPIDAHSLHDEADAAASMTHAPARACRALVQLALDAGGPDNITLAVIDIP